MQALRIVDTLINTLDATMAEQKEQTPSSLLMIPGPIEVDDDVYTALARKTASHVAPSFINEFGEALERFLTIIKADATCFPFILSGGGSLGWDAITAGLCEAELNDRALILNGGYFSDNFRECCKAYSVHIDEINASCVGAVVTPKELRAYLSDKSAPSPKLICITHVDTSIAAKTDVGALCAVCHELAPNAFIAVDGVCSFAGEDFRFSEWGVDICMTASQKAFGCPPGLCMMGASERAMSYMEKGRKNPIRSWYGNLMRWRPIMASYLARKPSYFSTPNVNLIVALNEAERQIVEEGVEAVLARHTAFSVCFQSALREIGLEFVAVTKESLSTTITAVKYPKGVEGKKLLTAIKTKGVIFAGGLHKEIKATYFRVGHMGKSVRVGSTDLLRCVEAIEYGLEECGYKFEKGAAVAKFKQMAHDAKLLTDVAKL